MSDTPPADRSSTTSDKYPLTNRSAVICRPSHGSCLRSLHFSPDLSPIVHDTAGNLRRIYRPSTRHFSIELRTVVLCFRRIRDLNVF